MELRGKLGNDGKGPYSQSKGRQDEVLQVQESFTGEFINFE